MEKTNAMRLVEQKNLPYTPHVCGSPAPLNALDVAPVSWGRTHNGYLKLW